MRRCPERSVAPGGVRLERKVYGRPQESGKLDACQIGTLRRYRTRSSKS